jgi:ADP-L-glycero-D-manno-heptose 6-epimerase
MILVTGGAGFIGSNVVAALEEAGISDIVVSDRLGTDERWRNLAKRKLRDLVEPDALYAFLARAGKSIDAIIHMGAVSSTTERDVDLIVKNNLRLSIDLWEWCATHRVRFIYASSAASYGDGQAGFDDEATSAALAKLKPLNAYAWSKHLFDRRVVADVEAGRPLPPQWAGLKFFNVYGPNEYHKGAMKSVVAQMYPDIVSAGRVSLFKSHRAGIPDGGQKRDFVSVNDCTDIILFLLRTPSVSGLFNVGTGKARSFADLAHATFTALNRKPEIHYRDMPAEIRPRYQYFTEARMERLRGAGYNKPFMSLEDGIAAYVRDYLDTDDPYR